jgi:RNA polymerase sigma factor (TIGR02999 family)|tara:strand:+ start:13642 stop:14217 length:576 start_codon:yes stop_codon:yes gene_type:complete
LEALTSIILDWSKGHKHSEDKLFSFTYDRFKLIASQTRKKVIKYQDDTNHVDDVIHSTTSLVHEAFLKLTAKNEIDAENSKEFFLLVSKIMRHILVDHYRKLTADKRTQKEAPKLGNQEDSSTVEYLNYISIEQGLSKLAKQHPRQAETFQMRYFLGFKNKEIANLQSVSESLIDKDLKFSKNWILNLQTA